MKHSKCSRLLALLLALVMVVGMMPTVAFAEEAEDVVVATEGQDKQTTSGDTTSSGEGTTEDVTTGEQVQSLAQKVYAASDNQTITLTAGTYEIPEGVESGKTVPTGLTISGAGAENTIVNVQGITQGESTATYFFDGGKAVTFKNLTINFGETSDFDGFARAGDMTFENVTIKGMGSLWGTGAVKFTNCSFVYPDEGYNEWTYNLWTYSGSSFTFENCAFAAKLGGGNEQNPAKGKFVNVYNQATTGTVGVSMDTCKFKTEKADGTSVTANKPILNVGTGSAWNISMSSIDISEAEAATDETTGSNLYGGSGISSSKTDTSVTINGTTAWTNGEKATANVAEVGGTGYPTLAEAFAALTAENHTLTLLDQSAWEAAKPVYWAAGEANGYATKLTDALTAAYMKSADSITIVCRPGADVGTMTHGHVADDLTIYGNNAYVSGGECDLEVDQYPYSRATGAQIDTKTATADDYLSKNITITAYELDNLGVWGTRNTTYTVTINLNDCDGKAIGNTGKTPQRVMLRGGVGTDIITLTDCDFIANGTQTTIHSTENGSITLKNCTFTDVEAPVNINHKLDGEIAITVENCTFKNCGYADTTGDLGQYAAPIRVANASSKNDNVSLTVTGCTFENTAGSNGDILIGDGRTGKTSNDVSLTVTNTAANVQAQQPGYYDGETTDESKKGAKTVTKEQTLTTSVTELTTSTELTDYVMVGGIAGFESTKFASFTEAYAAIKPELEKLCTDDALGQGVATAEAFDALFTKRDESGNATLTYTIVGNVTYDETGYDYLLTMGRRASHYGNDRHLINFRFVGGSNDKTKDTLTVNSNITLPYEWWGEKTTTTSISFENLTITGSAPRGLYATQAYFEGIDFKVDNCTLKGIKIYGYVNAVGSYTITNSTLDGTGTATNAYAIHLQGAKVDKNHATLADVPALTINISGNTISGYDRGINIDQVKANATISGNTISIKETGRSCIQLSSLATTTISGNTLNLTGGNAFTLHKYLLTCSEPTVNISDNTITGTGYLIYDDAAAEGNAFTADTLTLNYGTNTVDSTVDTTQGVKGSTKYALSGSVNTVVNGSTDPKGSEKNPYTREEFGKMTRAEYIAAQEKLGGTMYVNVGDYSYGPNGVLGNGVRVDKNGNGNLDTQLNYYNAPGGKTSDDGANGKNIVFVGGTITSGVTGYSSIDNIGTSLLLAVPAYTNVTFKKTNFKNVISFNYQLYTSPWSQMGALNFEGCKFNGIIVGAIAAQTLNFTGCEFTNYTNTTSPNSSNPTWIRPAYGNWTKGDNEGQGVDFRSLTSIVFENNKVTSTRPVKFERIAQWEMPTTVTVTGNTFDISKQGSETSTKNVGLYFGANAKFTLVADNNTKTGDTAALYTAVYSGGDLTIPGLPAGSKVTTRDGSEATLDAYKWKTTDKLTLQTTEANVNAKGSYTEGNQTKNYDANFATLADALAAVKGTATVTLLSDLTESKTATVLKDTTITLDLNGKTYTYTGTASAISVAADAALTVKDAASTGKLAATGAYSNGIENKGTLTIESGSIEADYGAVRALGGSTTTINGGTFSSSASRYSMYYWANGTALTVTVNGGTFKHSVSTAMENGKVTLSVKGGSFSNDLSAYCPDGHGTVLDSTSGLYVYGELKAPAGYAEDENGNVTISDEDGLFWFAKQVNEKGNTFAGKTVTLANNITLTKTWTPVGIYTQENPKPFRGTFDGNGHKITGLDVDGAYQEYGVGFFKTVVSATVKNVSFSNADVTGEYSNVVGVIAGYSYGSSTFENVHVTNSAVYAFGKVGGMVGMAEDAGATTTFKNCSITGTTIHGGYNVAGFLGLVMGNCNITGSYLSNNNVIIDEDSQGFGKVTELDTTVTCDGSVATCAGNGTVIKGKYIPNSDYYFSAYSDLYNHYGSDKHDCALTGTTLKLANSEVTHDAPVAIGDVKYSDLQAAFDAVKTGDTVTLLSDITLTDTATCLVSGITLEGSGHTITCNTATADTLNTTGKTAISFGSGNNYCTGVTVQNLKMTGTARFALYFHGGKVSTLTDVEISGSYWYAINLYGTHGATMTGCTISNNANLGVDNEGGASIWSNVASDFPLTLKNSKVGIIGINKYTSANKLAPKIFVMEGSEAEIHTLDDGTVSGNKMLCVSTTSTGAYSIKEYDKELQTWVVAKNYVAEIVGGKKYESLQAAIDAAKSNNTIKLLANTKENVTISTPYVTLNLNGHTLNGGTVAGKPALTVTARVTVKDVDESGNPTGKGTIKREDTAENSGVSSHYVIDVQGDGWLTFESGNVTNDSGNGQNTKGASLVRVGSDSVKKYPGLNIKGGTFTQNNFIVIKVERGDLFLNDGTLSSNNYAIQNWHRATIKGGTVNGLASSWTYGSLASDLTINGGTVNGNVYSVNYNNTATAAKVAINGGTVNGKMYTFVYDENAGTLNSTNDASKATIKVTAGTFSEDPTKYVVENSAVTKNADGTFGVAKAYLAKVGDTSYYTMDEAREAQSTSGKDIVLLRDYTTGSPFRSGISARVVDLNGHTWTCTGTDANSAAFEISNPDASLTVKNGKIVSSQLVGLIPSAMGGTIKYDNSSLTFENVEMSTTATSGIETNGNNTNDSVTLKNSTLNVPNGFGIYFPSSGTLTIDNSTINAKTMGVQLCAGSLSINEGSTITVSGDAVDKIEGDGAIQDGAAISIVNRNGYKGLGTIAVTGGKFTAKTGNDAIKAYNYENKNVSKFTVPETVSVSGGTFSSPVDETLCAKGYIPKTNKDGTYGVKTGKYMLEVRDADGNVLGKYEKFYDAIKAAKSGQTVFLLDDFNIGGLTINPNVAGITVDLNGKTVTGIAQQTFTISAKNVLLKNGKIVNTNPNPVSAIKVDRDITGVVIEDIQATCENGGYGLQLGTTAYRTMDVTVRGDNTNISGKLAGIAMFNSTVNNKDNPVTDIMTLNVEAGTISGGYYGIAGNGSNTAKNRQGNTVINIKGGTIKATAADGAGIYHPQDGVLNISGGEIEGATGVEIRAGKLTVTGGKITGTAATLTVTSNPNGSTTIGAGIAVAQHTTKKEIEVSITGGTIKGAAALSEANPQENPKEDIEKVTLSVTGGTFTGEIKSENKTGFISKPETGNGPLFDRQPSDDYCALGYTTKKAEGSDLYGLTEVDAQAAYVDADGKIAYGTLADALSNAKSGTTITLVNNADYNGYLYLAADKTIDLNGKTLTIGGELFGFGKMIDSTEGNGLLKVTADFKKLPSENPSLPVYDTTANGYRLYSYTMQNVDKHVYEDGRVAFAFKITFTNKDAWSKIASDDDSVSLHYDAKWVETSSMQMLFKSANVNKYAAQSASENADYCYFWMTLGGLEVLNGATLNMTPTLTSAFFTKTIDAVQYAPTTTES